VSIGLAGYIRATVEWAFLDFDGKPNTAFLGSLCWEEVG